MKRQILTPTLSLFLICAITTLLLAVSNQATMGPIAELEAQTALEAQQTVLPSAASFESHTAADGAAYSTGLDSSGQPVGYVFTTSASGYGGLIKVMTGLDTTGAITGVELLEISETAGLGMNAQKESFREQFVGLSGSVQVTKSAAGEGEITALTGATITSRAVTNAVNQALALYQTEIGGGHHGE